MKERGDKKGSSSSRPSLSVCGNANKHVQSSGRPCPAPVRLHMIPRRSQTLTGYCRISRTRGACESHPVVLCLPQNLESLRLSIVHTCTLQYRPPSLLALFALGILAASSTDSCSSSTIAAACATTSRTHERTQPSRLSEILYGSRTKDGLELILSEQFFVGPLGLPARNGDLLDELFPSLGMYLAPATSRFADWTIFPCHVLTPRPPPSLSVRYQALFLDRVLPPSLHRT